MAVRRKYYDQIVNMNVTFTDPSKELLVGVSVTTADFQRRHLIRTHQIKPYVAYTNITFKFIMAKPPQVYEEALKLENQTYGDILVLDFDDSRETSRSIKPYEFYKHVEKHMGVWKYVAKLDGDCFLNIPDFYKTYFNESTQSLGVALISLMIKGLGRFDWPMGAFEALSWRLMLFVNRLYENVPRTTWEEDLQLGWYLSDAEVDYIQVALDNERAYDFRPGTHPHWVTDVFYNAVRVHELKVEKDYVMVANCFNATGVNIAQIDRMRAANWDF